MGCYGDCLPPINDQLVDQINNQTMSLNQLANQSLIAHQSTLLYLH